MKRDLGLGDMVRILAALGLYADELRDQDEAGKCRALAQELAGCDRVVVVTIEESLR